MAEIKKRRATSLDINGRYKVGDLIGNHYNNEIAVGVVTKVTKKTINVEELFIPGHPCAPFYMENYVGFEGSVCPSGQEWGFTIPYKPNKHLIKSRIDKSFGRYVPYAGTLKFKEEKDFDYYPVISEDVAVFASSKVY